MSHVARRSYAHTSQNTNEEDIKKILAQPKWQTVEIAISDKDLVDNIEFLDDAVVLRCSAEGVPLMTTTAIYGPINPGDKVMLTPGQGTGVTVVEHNYTGDRLITKLEELQRAAPQPKKGNSITVNANWVSSKDGGALPNLDASANVFGSTGSLYVNDPSVTLPVLDVTHPDYHQTLAFYAGKLLQPREEFFMGFNLVLFGVEYDTSLPDYITDYAMSPSGGGGLFVEHHPFPHIFMPKPTVHGEEFCEARVTLGRKVENSDPAKPQFTFTTFKVPSDGSALVIKPDTIHNDSFTNGRLAVFVANTAADTVAFRETAPFKAINIKDAV
jgi:hypothetical protein